MSDSSKACFKCGKVGHFAWSCTYNGKKRDGVPPASSTNNSNYVPSEKKQDSIKNKTTRCYLCRKLGHFARSCPTTTGGISSSKYYDLDRPIENKRNEDMEDAPPPPALGNYINYDDQTLTQALDSIEERGWDLIKNDNELSPPKHGKLTEKYYKNVFLSNAKFTGYLDTCSEKCLIRYTAAKRAQLNVQLDDTDVMFNSPSFRGKIISIGKALTTLSVDNVEITNVEMYVVADDVLNCDVVVGRTWLDHPQIVMIKLDQTVHLINMNDNVMDKLRGLLQPVKTHLDVITSDDEVGNKRTSPKRRRHNSHSNHEEAARKSHQQFGEQRIQGRERSRSRERGRESLRNDRLSKNLRRSRERSRERYMRHGARR